MTNKIIVKTLGVLLGIAGIVTTFAGGALLSVEEVTVMKPEVETEDKTTKEDK